MAGMQTGRGKKDNSSPAITTLCKVKIKNNKSDQDHVESEM